jgi:polar amino acid transport system substrate-binding protein
MSAVGLATAAVLLMSGCASTAPEPAGSGTSSEPAQSPDGVDKDLRALLPKKLIDSGTVRVASDIPSPPFEFYDGDGKLVGVEYDLGQEMAKLLGVKFDFIKQPLAGALPGIKAGKYEIAITGAADVASRRESADMIDILNSTQGWLVAKGNPKGIAEADDLCGLRVATSQGGYSATIADLVNEHCASKGLPPVTKKEYSEQSSTFLAIKSGEADTTVNSGAFLKYLSDTVDNGTSYETIIFRVGTPTYVAFFVQKDDPELKGLSKAMQATMQKLMDNGTYLKVLKKWKLEEMAIPRALINGQE